MTECTQHTTYMCREPEHMRGRMHPATPPTHMPQARTRMAGCTQHTTYTRAMRQDTRMIGCTKHVIYT